MMVDVLMEQAFDEHVLKLVRASARIRLEIWLKTSRRNSPWDRFIVATMNGPEDGLSVRKTVNDRIVPYLPRIRDLLEKFNPTAIVAFVSSR